MHGQLWCPGVYGSRYQYARIRRRAYTHTPLRERLTPTCIGRRQVIMRDRRYGPILIVRIECGTATAAAPLLVAAASAKREQAATGLHRSFDAICAIYDTGMSVDSPPRPSLDPSRSRRGHRGRETREKMSRRIIIVIKLILPSGNSAGNGARFSSV